LNVTEHLAIDWFRSQGIPVEAITYNVHTSPDFTVAGLPYEVKLLLKNRIDFTSRQFKDFAKTNPTILVFKPNGKVPIIIASFLELSAFCGIRVAKESLGPQVRVEFEGELQKRFEILKKYYGLENNTELVRILINEKYKQLFPKEA
jgi:hypothetical protein